MAALGADEMVGEGGESEPTGAAGGVSAARAGAVPGGGHHCESGGHLGTETCSREEGGLEGRRWQRRWLRERRRRWLRERRRRWLRERWRRWLREGRWTGQVCDSEGDGQRGRASQGGRASQDVRASQRGRASPGDPEMAVQAVRRRTWNRELPRV